MPGHGGGWQDAPPRMAPQRPCFVSLDDLVAQVRDGDCVGVGGALLSRLPLAALHRLAARAPRALTYASWGGGLPLEILLGAGAVSKIIFCFSSLDIFGLAPLFRRALENAEVEVEEWSAFGFAARLEAAKQNLPYMPFRVPAAPDLPPAALFEPGSHPGIGHAPRLDLDILLLHAQRADEAGNIEIYGARGMDATAAFAARRVIVTVEEVVPVGTIGSLRNAFVLPREFVDAISVTPFGAYPTSCIPYYIADFRELSRVTAVSPPPASPPPGATRARMLAHASKLTLPQVRAAIRETSRPLTTTSVNSSLDDCTVDELMVWRLALLVEDNAVCSAGAVSPLAITSYLLAKATHAPSAQLLMTSGGLIDVGVRPMLLGLGEALDVASAASHCGGEDSYRWYYQQGRVAVEVVTAGQIDRYGRTNNLWVTSPNGRRIRLPGQGGMADVADLHQHFVLYITRQSPLSLVDAVERVSAMRALSDAATRTAAGLRPGSIHLVTNLAEYHFDLALGEFVLVSVHPGVSKEEVVAASGFVPAQAPQVAITGAPPAAVLGLLRREVDPLGIRRLEFVPAKERRKSLDACIAAEQSVISSALRLKDAL